jgi:hypothetical protein
MKLHVSFQSKFEKTVQLVGFITKKSVTVHDHMNVKIICTVTVVIVIGFTSVIDPAFLSTDSMINGAEQQ